MKNIFRILIPICVVVFAILYYKEGLLPVNPNSKKTEIFIVSPGTPTNEIVKNLYKHNFIRSELVFYAHIKNKGIEKKLQAGDFRLSQSMSASEIGDALTKGSIDVWVQVVEGLRKEEVAQILAEKIAISAVEFTSKAEEGYLFPDTYLIPKTASVDQIISIFRSNFDRKYDPQMREIARKKGLTDEQVVIVASLVEREARLHPDRVKVASIILKRLEQGWPLQIDATVQYALGYQPNTHTWWKKNLTRTDLSIDSPYNTYAKPGLPSGPIGNPSLSSIKAVIESDTKTPYWYYISDTKGVKMYFGTTLDEHNQNIARYLR